MADKIVFNGKTTERLHEISFKVMGIIYKEIEELGKEFNLNEREKTMAHYYVVENYMEAIRMAMKEIGIDDVKVRKYDRK